MCRVEDGRDIKAREIVSRAHKALSRGYRPDDTLIILIENWLIASEKIMAEVDAINAETAKKLNPPKIEDRIAQLEKQVASLRSDNYARAL